MRLTKSDKYIIYKVLFPNGKVYIGLTSRTLKVRRWEHENVAKVGKGHLFQSALRKHWGDKSNIKWSILEKDLTLEEANEREVFYIRVLESLNPKGYNQTIGGLASKFSEDTRMRMSIAKMGHKHSKETRLKMGLAGKGRIRTEDSNEKQAKSMKGEPFLVFHKDTEELIGEWRVVRKCGRDLGIDASNLSKCLKGNLEYLKFYKFKYKR
jgi:group I intron endonuclease